MTWSPKKALVKEAKKIADEKHPEGWNKTQLIDASKEVFGGYAANPDKPLKTMEDVHQKGNYFSEIDGHYPRGMSGCMTVGLSGGCGFECPVFRDGECHEHGKEMIENGHAYRDLEDFFDNQEIQELKEMYGMEGE